MTKSFAAIVFAAVTLLAATGAQAGNPSDALLGGPVLAQTETSAQRVAPKDQVPTEQGGKREPGGN